MNYLVASRTPFFTWLPTEILWLLSPLVGLSPLSFSIFDGSWIRNLLIRSAFKRQTKERRDSDYETCRQNKGARICMKYRCGFTPVVAVLQILLKSRSLTDLKLYGIDGISVESLFINEIFFFRCSFLWIPWAFVKIHFTLWLGNFDAFF